MSAFKWNKGGWFGAQIGGTCWLLILAVLVSFRDPFTGAIAFACFAVPNLYGWSLWRRRDRLRAYPSIQKLVVVEGVFALSSQVSQPSMYAVLLVFPLILLQFHLQERGARKAQSQGIS